MLRDSSASGALPQCCLVLSVFSFQFIKEKVFLTYVYLTVFGYAHGSQESEAVDPLGAGVVSSSEPPDVGSGN